MNVGDKFNTNEKLILAYHEGMNGHFELVKRLETHNSSLNNNISNMQKKIMQQSIILNCYNIKFHNMKKKDIMNRFVKQQIVIKNVKLLVHILHEQRRMMSSYKT